MSAPLRALRPYLPGQTPPSAPASTPQKRSITKVACKSCHQRKYKCDGARPVCKACRDKSLTCEYEFAEGEIRPSLKRKNQTLQRDLGGTLELLWHMQHGSDSDARLLFSRLREGEDPSAILASLSLLDLGAHTGKRLHSSSSANTSPEATETASELATTQTSAPETREQARSQGTSQQQPVSSTNPNLPSAHPASASFAPSLQPPPTSLHDFHLPDRTDVASLAAAIRAQSGTFKHAFSVFLQCTATIFHVFTQGEVDALLEASLRDDGDDVAPSTLCQACAVAAFGSWYSRSQISPQMGDYYFNVTKQLLDECIQQKPLGAIKVCALMALCNIVNKATAAFAYVELGIAVARFHGLLGRERRADLDPETWVDSKKVCQSLLLCRNWLQTTLSYVPRKVDRLNIQDVDPQYDYDSEENAFYQTQVARLTVIKAEIFRHMFDTDFSRSSSQAMHASLTDWLDSLPEKMQLGNLGHRSITPEARIARLYLHSFYLGGEMLLYRWTLSCVTQTTTQGDGMTEDDEGEATRCAEEGVRAAKASANILHTLYTEGAAVKHCWLCIFQSYLSCCILLYDTLQRALCGLSLDSHGLILSLASKSLEVLSWAGKLDPTANEYYSILKPIYDTSKRVMTQPDFGTPSQGKSHSHFSHIPGSTSFHNAARALSHMLYVPLKTTVKDQNQRKGYRPPLDQTTINMDEMGLGIHLSWALEFTAPCFTDTGQEEDINQLSSASLLKNTTQLFGRFLNGPAPSGWATNKSFTDPSLTNGSTTDILR